MGSVSDDRAAWLARHILPCEGMLRARLARWRLPGDLEADDIVQEVYGKLAALPSVTQIVDPRTYLFGIAHTIVLMHLRRARIIPIRSLGPEDDAVLATSDPSPEVQASDRQQLHLLALAVADLREPARTVFRLRKIDGLSYRDIGARLGVTENAVQKLMVRSMTRLITALGRGGNEDRRASMPGRSDERTDAR